MKFKILGKSIRVRKTVTPRLTWTTHPIIGGKRYNYFGISIDIARW